MVLFDAMRLGLIADKGCEGGEGFFANTHLPNEQQIASLIGNNSFNSKNMVNSDVENEDLHLLIGKDTVKVIEKLVEFISDFIIIGDLRISFVD